MSLSPEARPCAPAAAVLGRLASAAVLCAALAAAGPAGADTMVAGAGSTDVFPALQQWMVGFQEASATPVAYQPIGSVGGIAQLDDGTVTFAIVEAQVEAKRLAGQGYVQFPIVVDAVVPVVNLPGIGADALTLDAETLAGLLSGSVARWSDPAIAALNPGLTLPDLPVAPVHRAEPSDATARLTGWLTASVPAFAQAVGSDAEVAWPGGRAAEGGAGVAAAVTGTPGSIGYVSGADIVAARLAPVKLKTADGSVASYSTAGLAITAEAASVADPDPSGLGPALVGEADGGDWPLAVAVYAVMEQVPEDRDSSIAALRFFQFVLAADAETEALGLAPLPPAIAAAVEAKWASEFRLDDKPIWPPAK